MAYNIPLTLNNLLTSQYDLTELAKEIRDITGNERAYNEFIRQLPKNIKNPNGLSKLLLNSTSPFGFLENIALNTTGEDAFSQFSKIAVVGICISNSMNDIRNNILPCFSTVTAAEYDPAINTTIQLWKENTLERKQRNLNRLNIFNTFRLIGLIGMYETAARQNYTTTKEIEAVRATLELYYEALIENDMTNTIITDVKNNIDILKNRTNEVLNIKSQNAYSITTIILERPYSAKMISYELYGEFIQNEDEWEALANIIIGLNRDQPAHALNGEITIIEIKTQDGKIKI